MCLTHSADAHLAPAVLQALCHLLSRAQHRWESLPSRCSYSSCRGQGVRGMRQTKAQTAKAPRRGNWWRAERMAREEVTFGTRPYGMVSGGVPGRRDSNPKALKQDKARFACTPERNSGWSAGRQSSGAQGRRGVESQGLRSQRREFRS